MADLDTRTPAAVLATKGNIVPSDEFSASALYDQATGNFWAEGTDASLGADSVFTIDGAQNGSPAVALDTGALSAGTYAVTATLRHPGAAAATRQLSLVHMDAANAVVLETLGTTLAGKSTLRITRYITVRASERFKVISGADATNLAVYGKLIVRRVD